MIILQKPSLTLPAQCPYLKEENNFVQKYFFAHNLTPSEYETLLNDTWRRFGIFYFKYSCPTCNKCKPLRIIVKDFKPSKSQKKVIKKNQNTSVTIKPLSPSFEIYKIYAKHSETKFNQKTEFKNFLETFYHNETFAFQSEYRIKGKLVAIGFLDITLKSINSIYFAYDTDYADYSLGTYSIIYEINYALSIGKSYYYIGYYIKENQSMSYKNKFKPNQIFNLEKKTWLNNE